MHKTPPNILLVFADQMRACDLGFMRNGASGNEAPVVRAEHLERLAAEGVTFTHALSSCPLCTPYRASLLTGRHALSIGMVLNDVRLPTDQVTIAHVLKSAGYDTAYIGKWHLDGPYRGGFTPPGPRRQGFDYWAVANCTHDYMRSFYYRDDPEPIWIAGYDADHFTDLAIAYIHTHRYRPFCLVLSWGPPHDPYRLMPPEYMVYDAASMALRPNVRGDWRDETAGYYSHIVALDRNLGRLMTALDEARLADDTILVFTSDHGDMLGSHGERWKQRPWDESIMVPFVMRWPGHCPAGHRTPALLNVTDIMPTLLELAMGTQGVAPDGPERQASGDDNGDMERPGVWPRVEGESFAAAALGAETCGPPSAFIHNTCPFGDPVPEWRGVRTERYTYVRTLHGPWLLYDNEADPYQMENLANRPRWARVQKELDDQLRGWLDIVGDDFQPREVYWQRFGFQVDEVGQIPCVFEVGKSDL